MVYRRQNYIFIQIIEETLMRIHCISCELQSNILNTYFDEFRVYNNKIKAIRLLLADSSFSENTFNYYFF